MTLQEFLFQSANYKKSAPLQLLEHSREVVDEAHRVCAFQDSQRPREREISAQRNRPPDLFIDQKHIHPQGFRQQNGFPFAPM